jgi:hypothetical protein
MTRVSFSSLASKTVRRRVKSYAGVLLLLLPLAACDMPTSVRTKPASIQLVTDHVSATMIGETIQLDVSGFDASGSAITPDNLVWDLSNQDILQSLGSGAFRVLREGDVRIAIVYRHDPSIRVTATVNVAASFMARACIRMTDQDPTGLKATCVQQQLTVFARGDS